MQVLTPLFNLSAGNFPIQLPTGPGSSVTVVMVVFRDYEGNTAISSGSVDISDTGGGFFYLLFFLPPFPWSVLQPMHSYSMQRRDYSTILHVYASWCTVAHILYQPGYFIFLAIGLHINSRSLDPATSLVQFNPSNYTVNEHETVVTLSAERVGNTSLSLLVDFATRNGTALGMLLYMSL